MKRVVFLLLAAGIPLLSGCEKTKVGESQQQEPEVVSEPEPAVVPGIVILNGLSIADIPQTEVGVPEVKYINKHLTVGEEVAIVGEPVSALYRGDEREYSLIRYKDGEEREGYVRTPYIVPDSTFGVIANDQAVIYSSPKITAPTDTVLPRMSFVAVHNDFKDADFVRISYANQENSYLYTDRYLKKTDVSTNEQDTASAVLYFLAMKSDGIAREELLRNASSMQSSIFMDQIAQAIAGSEPAPDYTVKEISRSAVVIGKKVNVRTAPTVSGSKVIGQLSTNDRILVNARTDELVEVDGARDYWYRIENPAGWIFGHYIELE